MNQHGHNRRVIAGPILAVAIGAAISAFTGYGVALGITAALLAYASCLLWTEWRAQR